MPPSPARPLPWQRTFGPTTITSSSSRDRFPIIRPMRRAARLDPAEMKDARMFSTLEGAKKFAKNLKSLFDDSGIIFPLNRCQNAAAIAGGFRDWHDLSRSLEGSDRPVDPGAFRRRLIA